MKWQIINKMKIVLITRTMKTTAEIILETITIIKIALILETIKKLQKKNNKIILKIKKLDEWFISSSLFLIISWI